MQAGPASGVGELGFGDGEAGVKKVGWASFFTLLIARSVLPAIGPVASAAGRLENRDLRIDTGLVFLVG